VNYIHFAGEHTSAKFNGHEQGAYFSGIGAAKEVISSIESQSGYFHPLADRAKGIQEKWMNTLGHF
jgi:hypothetical protein